MNTAPSMSSSVTVRPELPARAAAAASRHAAVVRVAALPSAMAPVV